MKKMKKSTWGKKISVLAASLVLVLALGLLPDGFAIVSNAQSQGKVTATSANIRKSADTGSDIVGSATKDAKVTINNQVTGSDGKTWYQVFVDADTLGYIRSDLVEITDGTTPPKGSNDAGTTTPETPSNPPADESPANVTETEPTSASVTGGQSVRVRANASTNSSIVTQAQSGMALTVIGEATGSDGKVWYQVNFLSNNKEVTGFIRSDYVELSGELKPAGQEPEAPEEETPVEPEAPVEPEVTTKDWDTTYEDGSWYLLNNANNKKYTIDNIFETMTALQEQADVAEKKATSRLVWIIILVILVVGMAAVVAYFVFKMKDDADSAYFAQVERETLRRRTADRPTSGGQRVMHTVGANKPQSGARPAGTRPAGARPIEGRPAGTRPAGARPAEGRPVGTRPAGARPVEGRPVGTRPAGARPVEGTRPAGARPAGARPIEGRPVGTRPAGTRPVAPSPTPTPRAQQGNDAQNPAWKPKNFINNNSETEDEFEYDFLNWNGEDEQ